MYLPVEPNSKTLGYVNVTSLAVIPSEYKSEIYLTALYKYLILYQVVLSILPVTAKSNIS